MTVKDLIDYLRLSVSVSTPGDVVESTDFLSMTDEDLTLFLQIAMTRDFPQIPTLERLPAESVYPLMLLAKKELYYTMACKFAPQFSLVADNNNQLMRKGKFDSIMKLIAQVDKEYQDYLEDGGGSGTNGTLSTYNVLLPSRYDTKYNYEHGSVPFPLIYVDRVYEDKVEISWTCSFSKFACYRVYFSSKPIVDKYTGSKNLITTGSTLIKTIKDVHQCKCRISNLLPGTEYHIAVAGVEMSGLIGADEVTINTLPTVQDVEPLVDYTDVSI